MLRFHWMICLVFLPSVFAYAQDASSTPRGSITEKMRADAAKVTPLVRSGLAKDFLAATSKLAEPSQRLVYRNSEKSLAVSKRVFDAMSSDQQAGWTPREFPPDFYYETAYGSPLVYTRLLDLIHPYWSVQETRKLLDFGYGTIGQLQLLAHCGFEAHGVDVEPVFPALYSEPGDTGPMGSGKVAIHAGQWPANPDLREAVGQGYSVISSKNTLKSGYIHPNPPAGQTVDPKRLVHLGVHEDEFLRLVRSSLIPGGIFIIYNICPAQNPPDQPYLPYADGKSPFSCQDFERAGFEVLAFDIEDQDWVLDCFKVLGYTEGKSREEAAKEYFCWYTVVRRGAKE